MVPAPVINTCTDMSGDPVESEPGGNTSKAVSISSVCSVSASKDKSTAKAIGASRTAMHRAVK